MKEFKFKIEPVKDPNTFLFRIVEENSGPKEMPSVYTGIATLKIGERLFGAVTSYYEGTLPHEQVFEIIPQPTELIPEKD